MNNITIRHYPLLLTPDNTRVIIRSFIPNSELHKATVIGRALALTEDEVEQELQEVRAAFGERHIDLEGTLRNQYTLMQPHIFSQRPLSLARQLLIGALFCGEYALEAAALFNPSMVAHPDQSGLAEGGLRFIMSLRATGEGHISSIEFRSGTIDADGDISLTPVTRFAALAGVESNPTYRKKDFLIKLHEMGVENEYVSTVMNALPEGFSRSNLVDSVAYVEREVLPMTRECQRTLECVQWLADSNYEIRFASTLEISERVIFPVSTNESNGIEDARFVRFTEEDETVKYYATYTAYNGHKILPQLIETQDFLHFRILTLNGSAVQNKGMAIFPRRINGQYVMISRQDDENLYLMFSNNPHYWCDPQILLRPAETWEGVKIGNCGSPIETEAGWLVITHGVGPMRRYCIGAVLLDREDPAKVIGRLREPLLFPQAGERDGYVPNVVYSCGALRHGNRIILPYAKNDSVAVIASMDLGELLTALQA